MSRPTLPHKFNSVQQVQTYAKENQRDLLVLEDSILDVTTFAPHHPGGAALLRNRRGSEISQDMKFHHPLTLNMANSMVISSFRKDIARLITPDQPLLPQIWALNHQQYMELVYSPHWLFVPSPRMFQTNFMESFSHCKWWTVPILPLLVIAFLFRQVEDWNSIHPSKAILTCLSGFLFFTFAEYFLHRFIFHSQRHLPDSRLAHYIHFFAHGIHHMLPNDPDRLVLPIPMYCVIFTLGYYTVGKVISFDDALASALFWSFFQLGYVCYDLCHYALHHIDTSKSKSGYFHDLQRYHNQHHFGGQEAGFGVSSKLWDVILRTGYTRSKKQE